ncbi:MAG: type II toxin-antitoxin system VapC family toxin [Candidatus Binataceae bacterium]
MRFWDSSALVPLFVAEVFSRRVARWLSSDPVVVVWTLSRVEIISAIARRAREQPGSASLRRVRREVLAMSERWSEVTALEQVRRHAERVLLAHPLGAADALQIGAAIVGAEGDPPGLEFVTLDQRLADVAEREGFRVLSRESR